MTDSRSIVALSKGDSRYSNIARALSLISSQVDLAGKQRVVIKPNFVSARRQLAATHADAVRAVLDFVRQRYNGKVVIAERAEVGTTAEAWRNFGYHDLAREYGVELLELNGREQVECRGYDSKLKPISLRVDGYLANSDYRISVNPAKTHDTVLVTLSAKNMAVGCLVKDGHGNDRKRFHQGYPVSNLNLYRIVRQVYPHLAVIDGFEGMEGNGPEHGDPVDLRVAVASTDFVAADAVMAAVMGQDPQQVGYLTYCQAGGLGYCDLPSIRVVGGSIQDCCRPFRPHPDHSNQLRWHIPNVEQFL